MIQPKQTVVILDIRSLGYYNIMQGVFQKKFSNYYSFESLQNIFE